jgi:hypothetical protein
LNAVTAKVKLNIANIILLLLLAKRISMAASKKKATENSTSKKKTRKQVQKKLELALASLKPLLGEKKFKNRIKKAGKIISDGLKKDLNENNVAKNAKPLPEELKPVPKIAENLNV